MAGGQKIDDHSSWVGKGSDGSVFPMGCKTKTVRNAEGAGELARYEDTSEEIVSYQDKARSEAKGRPLKAGYRN